MPRDEFICPACGETVPAGAKACPECGDDERTGWSDQTVYDGTGIEDPSEFNYDEFMEREFGTPKPHGAHQWFWWAVAAVTLAAFVANHKLPRRRIEREQLHKTARRANLLPHHQVRWRIFNLRRR